MYPTHALMNHEISYVFQPKYLEKFLLGEESLREEQLKELDLLAGLLRDPDESFDTLTDWWETRRHFRELSSPLV